MWMLHAVFCLLLPAAFSAPVKVEENAMVLFHGEDLHLLLPSLSWEVSFRNRSAPRAGDVTLLRGGGVVNDRAQLNQHYSHLVISDVGEGDEGTYTLRNPEEPEDVRRVTLTVRDCTNEQTVKYGDNYNISVAGVTTPITLEFRPSAVEANETSRPGQVVLKATGAPTDDYVGRITLDKRHVTLRAARGADEGSYTVMDGKGGIRKKVCLGVREHRVFTTLPLGARLEINLILNSSLVQLHYGHSEEDSAPSLLLDKGEFTSVSKDLGLEERLSIEGSLLFLDQVKRSDAGVFKVTDIQGFTVSYVHLRLKPYQLETLYVAILALLGLLVFLLLVCLLSCLIKVKKRAKRAAALEKLGQDAGKEDEGEAFREVVKNLTKLSEESKHSQTDNTEKSQSTEVDIKGLEVSSKEVGVGNLETSDSGVGFNTNLPLDTDTEAPDQLPESEAVSVSVAAPEVEPAAPAAAAAAEPKPSPVVETKAGADADPQKLPEKPVKLSPGPGPEAKTGLSPSEPKSASPAPSPAPSPALEPKPATPKATTPTPESKAAPGTPKAPTPEPMTNGTAEPGPDSDDVIGAPPPKTPEGDLKASAVETKTEAPIEAAAEDPAAST